MTPTSDDEPHSPASPNSAAASRTRIHLTPASTRATRRSGSMDRPCMRRVVIMTEPAALRTGPWPVAWTATPSPRAVAQETAAATSAAQVAPTAIAGVCWTATFQVATSAAMPSSPAA